jgi:hypothetical protein
VSISLSKTCFIFVWKIVRTPLPVIDKDNHLSKPNFYLSVLQMKSSSTCLITASLCEGSFFYFYVESPPSTIMHRLREHSCNSEYNVHCPKVTIHWWTGLSSGAAYYRWRAAPRWHCSDVGPNCFCTRARVTKCKSKTVTEPKPLYVINIIDKSKKRKSKQANFLTIIYIFLLFQNLQTNNTMKKATTNILVLLTTWHRNTTTPYLVASVRYNFQLIRNNCHIKFTWLPSSNQM